MGIIKVVIAPAIHVGGDGATVVIDNLTSESMTAALSANQGNVLKGLIEDLQGQIDSITSGNNIVVDAGGNQVISVSSAILEAIANDPTGSIVSYLWSKVSGPVEPKGIGFNGGVFTPLRTRTFTPPGNGDIVFDESNTLPGDLIILQGNFRSVTLNNVEGTTENPIVFRNPDGQITKIGNTTWANDGGPAYALKTTNSRRFIFAGTHWNNLLFTGSEVDTDGGGEPYRAVYRNFSFDALSEDFEICYFTATKGGTCFVFKTDPATADSQTWFPNRELIGALVHDFIIDNPYNEGMYIGHTALYVDMTTGLPYAQNIYDPPPGDTSRYKRPIMIGATKIWNGVVKNTGKDGIQISAVKNAEVYQNEIFNWASVDIPDRVNHNGGILIGGRSEASNVHDNIIHDSWGEHFQFYGSGEGHELKNNLFFNVDAAGANPNGSILSFAARIGSNNTEYNPGQVTVEGNTISRPSPTGNIVRVNGFFNKQGSASGSDYLQVLLKKNILMAPKNNTPGDNYDSYYVYTENPQDYTYATIVTRPMAGADANVQYPTVAAANVDTENYYLPTSGAVTQGFRKTNDDGPQPVIGGSVIVTPNAATTEVNGLVNGVYTFRCTVTNDQEQAKSATTQVTVEV